MLTVTDVSKRYGDRAALDRVAFEVPPGGLTGFVGANGSGKTTTMRIMMGVLAADSGSVTMNGRELTAQARRSFGYMPEERGLYPKMRVGEQIAYLGRLHGMSRGDATASADSLLDRLGLTERSGELIESLSLGNQQRAQIAAALVHSPTVLILDEPFSGLDPIAVETVLGVLEEFAANGAPVLFSSHQLDIVERLCDHLVVIAEGAVKASGSRDELRASHSSPRWELRLGGDAGWVREVSGVSAVELDGSSSSFEADAATAQTVLRTALDAGVVHHFAAQHPTLSQIFQEVVR